MFTGCFRLFCHYLDDSGNKLSNWLNLVLVASESVNLSLKAPPIISGISDINAGSFKVNGEKASLKQVNKILETATTEELAKINIEVKNNNALENEVRNKQRDAILETQIDAKVEDPADRKKLVDLEKQRAKAEVDAKKKGIQAVPDAKETLENIEIQINEIVGKYTAVDGRTKDVKARKKVAEEVRNIFADKNFEKNLDFAKKHSKLYGLEVEDDLTQEQIKEKYGDDLASSLGFSLIVL